VLCHNCYRRSNHEGHDVAFYHAQAGGCCDCGDPDAWDPRGFCDIHGPNAVGGGDKDGFEEEKVVFAKGCVVAVADWLVGVSQDCDEAFCTEEDEDDCDVVDGSSGSASLDGVLLGGLNPNEVRTDLNAAAAAAYASVDNGHIPMEGDNIVSNILLADAADTNTDTTDTMGKTEAHSSSSESSIEHDTDFHPEMAGSVRQNRPPKLPPRKKTPPSSKKNPSSQALALGEKGRLNNGLFLILHSDDVHSTETITSALHELLGGWPRDTLLSKIVKLVKSSGELVILGTSELIAECGIVTVKCWKDGDRIATQRVGRWMLDKAHILTKRGLSCSIKTRTQLEREQRASAVISWLSVLARSCDTLCHTMAEAIEMKHLVPLLRSDLKLSRKITQGWHALLLTLLAVPNFKMELAKGYCDTYGGVTKEYARGIGISDCSSFTLSVQFLNRQTYVRELASSRQLLSRLTSALLCTLQTALTAAQEKITNRAIVLLGVSQVSPVTKVLNPLHPVLSHRRYSPCISDLKCVLNVAGMARMFASTCLDTWIHCLATGQGMDKQIWRSPNQGHVETEPRGWVGAFNCSISLGSLFERVLAWEDGDESPIDLTKSTSDSGQPLNGLLTCAQITHQVLKGVHLWQQIEILHYTTTTNISSIPAHARCSASLPYSTVHAKHGTYLAQPALPISQMEPWSFHYPLHRFLAVCFREVARRSDEVGSIDSIGANNDGLSAWMENMRNSANAGKVWRVMMEFPIFSLSRAAQIRAELWKRNGPGMKDQVLNYAEPPFCRALRDADLTLLQFATLGLNSMNHDTDRHLPGETGCGNGTAYLINLLLHRFGVFDFAGFGKAPTRDFVGYSREIKEGIYPGEPSCTSIESSDHNLPNTDLSFASAAESIDSNLTHGDSAVSSSDGVPLMVLPWTYSPSRGDVTSSIRLLEELLHLLIVLITELPPPPSSTELGPEGSAGKILHAKRRLRREVIHRLASGPKTHSELAEVHHVLPQRDNSTLSEVGKLLNPDDAGGAALEATLAEVAERKPSRGLEPDQWVLRKEIWDEYDPAFYHVSALAHESAAANRPKPAITEPGNGGHPEKYPPPRPYAPKPSTSHLVLKRLRRDITADSSLVALTYRVLHVHCVRTDILDGGNSTGLRGKSAYEREAMNETALARAVHILTLGAYCWEDNYAYDYKSSSWKDYGGGTVGSIFHNIPKDTPEPPTAKDWIQSVLLGSPDKITDCEWYAKEDNLLILLQRLAAEGGGRNGKFVAQDNAVKSGASWLCKYAAKHNPEASSLIGGLANQRASELNSAGAENNIERRKKEARERALKKMQANAARFAAMMEPDDESDETISVEKPNETPPQATSTLGTSMAYHDDPSSVSPVCTVVGDNCLSGVIDIEKNVASSSLKTADSPQKMRERVVGLLRERPRCIICVDDGSGDTDRTDIQSESKSGRASNGALAFCGLVQASTVLKGGGGPSAGGSVSRLVGVHVTLCGHAVHSSCSDAYLASMAQRDNSIERLEAGKQGEFRCPMCQRLSNCLVPFIDVGTDWIDSREPKPVSSSVCVDGGEPDTNSKSYRGLSMMDVDDAIEKETIRSNAPTEAVGGKKKSDLDTSLHAFLSKHVWMDDNSVWDGRCNFVGHRSLSESDFNGGNDVSQSEERNDRKSPTRRSLRLNAMRNGIKSFGKKDLFSAWNNVMRTPRSRKKAFGFESSSIDSAKMDVSRDASIVSNSETPLAGTEVWRRLMYQVFEISRQADFKRLGEESMMRDYGEFRHDLVEKAAYNAKNRAVGKEIIDWPKCIQRSLSQSCKLEFSREQLISRLLLTIQAFTYSCCAEAAEVRRLNNKFSTAADAPQGSRNFFAKFGVLAVICNGTLVAMPKPSSAGGGEQVFEGRLGKLRFLGLAVIAATSPVSREIVQLSLDFPANNCVITDRDKHNCEYTKERAPIAYHILCGHVLTHTVAAMCASCGRGRAIDFFDASEDGYNSDNNQDPAIDYSDSSQVLTDCENFIKLGFVARVLQVLLGEMGMSNANTETPPEHEMKLLNVLDSLLVIESTPGGTGSDWDDSCWRQGCCVLVKTALEASCHEKKSAASFEDDKNLRESISTAFLAARIEGESFLQDACLIFQVLCPGAANEGRENGAISANGDFSISQNTTLEKLARWLGMESLSEMLKSPLVKNIVASWYKKTHVKQNNPQSEMEKQLSYKREFRVYDWPVAMTTNEEYSETGKFRNTNSTVQKTEPLSSVTREMVAFNSATCNSQSTSPKIVAADDESLCPPHSSFGQSKGKQHLPSDPSYNPKKCVPLLGGYTSYDSNEKVTSSPRRIRVLPTSYTDLYAQLGVLCPDSDNTALCLVCGAVLNAGGKGECTKHAVKCGAGYGIFFLLQECVGLILHKERAAYVHSPYVDSHGETPQYRGRPLNLDLDRYEILHEMWAGHLVREKVISERANQKQVIIAHFY